MELLDSLAQKPLVILITSKRDYAVEAFEYRVLDYLVKSEQSRNIELMLEGELVSFNAQQWKDVNVDANQRLSFNVPLDEKIAAGLYRANVYSNAGFLGAVNFRLQ